MFKLFVYGFVFYVFWQIFFKKEKKKPRLKLIKGEKK